MWASTHVLSDEPGHAWQSSVLLGQLGTGCLRRLPSAPALPTAPSLGQQHYCCVDNMQRGSHHSSQGLFPCPQQSVTLFSSSFFFAQIPALPARAFLFTPHSMPGRPRRWLRPRRKRSARRTGCLGGDAKHLYRLWNAMQNGGGLILVQNA